MIDLAKQTKKKKKQTNENSFYYEIQKGFSAMRDVLSRKIK